MGHKSYPKVEIAFKIAARYPDRIPTAAELELEYGFSRSRAYEFKRAMRKARDHEQAMQASLDRIKDACAQMSGAI